MSKNRIAFMPLNTYPEPAPDDAIRAAVKFAASLDSSLQIVTYAVDIPTMYSPLGNLLLDVPELVRAAELKCRNACQRWGSWRKTRRGPQSGWKSPAARWYWVGCSMLLRCRRATLTLPSCRGRPKASRTRTSLKLSSSDRDDPPSWCRRQPERNRSSMSPSPGTAAGLPRAPSAMPSHSSRPATASRC